MNIRLNSTFARVAAATGLLVGSTLVGCSGSDETPIAPGPSASGSTSMGATAAGGSSAAGTSAMGGGGVSGSAGAASGSGGGAACPGNQIMLNGACSCPAYAATYCEALTKCVSEKKDPDNCGTCGMACGAMNACSEGVCTPNLATFGELAGCGKLLLVSVTGKLFALSTMTGDLNAFALPAGGAPTKVGTVAGATAFAVDATNAYIAAGKTVVRQPLAGGASAIMVTEATADVKDVAVADGKVFYVAGKSVKQLDAAATAGTGVVVAESADEGVAEGLAVAGGFVLYASNLAYNLEADPIAGEGHVKVGASQSGLIFGHRSVQADATHVYWANNSLQQAKYAGTDHAGVVVAQPIDGSKIIAFAVDGVAKTAFIATEDGKLEKSTFESAGAGNEATWVARAVPTVSSIVLDDASAYIASECKILKSAR